ncbi:MAG: hypothetical protein WCQ96_03055 [Patescibacteria group bacterium]
MKYYLQVTFNDKTTRKWTTSIKETFMSLKPDILRSNVTIKVTAGGKRAEKFLFLPQARNAFRNNLSAEILERQLITLL